MEVGKIIKNFRENFELSQAELGKRLGITSQTVSSWEIGRTNPDLIQLERLSRIFMCSIDELLGITEQTAQIDFPKLKRDKSLMKHVSMLALLPRKRRLEVYKYIEFMSQNYGKEE